MKGCVIVSPPDEEAVSKMMSMMEDKQLQEEFPLLAQVNGVMGSVPGKLPK